MQHIIDILTPEPYTIDEEVAKARRQLELKEGNDKGLCRKTAGRSRTAYEGFTRCHGGPSTEKTKGKNS